MLWRVRDKMAEEKNPLYPAVIFIILNLIFISLLFVGIVKFSSGAAVYEEVYAKKIGLLLDYANPEMEIRLDFSRGIDICNDVGCDGSSMVEIREEKILLKLSSGGGYSFEHFKDDSYELSYEDNFLIIKVKEKENE